jgi:phosphatidate cytidylyltransferase
MLRTRILTVLVVLPLFLAALFLASDFLWRALMLVIVAVAFLEWSNLARYGGTAAAIYVALSVAMMGALWYAAAHHGGVASINRTLLLVATLFWLITAPLLIRLRMPLESAWVMALVGWLALIPGWVALVELREMGPMLLFLVMGVVWIADTAAYFCGRAFGKHKLAPAISPGKTWEGVIGALLASAIYAAIAHTLARHLSPDARLMPLIYAMIGAPALAAVSVVGDLFESRLKRQRGIKDSGTLFPGHGGILDRIDSLSASLPVAAFLFSSFAILGY